VEARGEPDVLPQLLRVREGRLLQHRLRPDRVGSRRPGLHVRLRERDRPGLVRELLPRPASEGPQRRRQLLLPGRGGEPRAEVRLRLPRGDHQHDHPLQRQPALRRHQQPDRLRRVRRPRLRRDQRRQVPQLLRGRHVHEGPPVAQRRPPLGPADVQELAQQRGRQRVLPRPAARAELPGQHGQRHRLEGLVPAGGAELRPRRRPQDGAAGLLRPLRQPAQRALGSPVREPGRGRLSGICLERRQR
jgi:hypothetical protein